MNKFKNIFDYIYYERKKLILFGILLITIIPFIFFLLHKENKEDVIEEEIVEVKEEKKDDIKKTLMVDIKGEVNIPGCYEVDETSRVKDIIDLAGGLTENASTDNINLSSKVYDEMVIVINKKEEVTTIIENKDTITVNKTETPKTSANSKVSINNAGISELITLNGIKEARAKKIIEYRESNGPFKSIEEIKNVSGIGEAIFAKIKDYITL